MDDGLQACQQFDVTSTPVMREHRSIESNQPLTMPARKRQQVHIGHLPVPVYRRHIRVSQRDVVDQEPVPSGRAQGDKGETSIGDGHDSRKSLWIRRDSYEAALGQRTGRPARRCVLRKPSSDAHVVDV